MPTYTSFNFSFTSHFTSWQKHKGVPRTSQDAYCRVSWVKHSQEVEDLFSSFKQIIKLLHHFIITQPLLKFAGEQNLQYSSWHRQTAKDHGFYHLMNRPFLLRRQKCLRIFCTTSYNNPS